MMKSVHTPRVGHTLHSSGAQRGISLVIVMIFLVILSVLGVSAMQGSSLSSRIARNESDRNLAFQAAEAALKDGENDAKYLRFDLTSCTSAIAGCRAAAISGSDFDGSCTTGLCDPKAIASPVWEDSTKWSTTGASVAYGTRTGAASLPVVGQQPRYLIEYFNFDGKSVYRITSVGFGANTSSQVMLQTAFKSIS